MNQIFFVILTFISLFAKAQIEIVAAPPDTNAVLKEENVTIFKDARLDILDKRPVYVAKAETDTKEKEMPVYRPIISADGKKTVTGSIYTKKGFRVVIYNGSDRLKAYEVKNAFSRAFPGIPSYISYNVPSYKIKVGNFDDRGEAGKFIRRISAAFPTSFIVPDIVTHKKY